MSKETMTVEEHINGIVRLQSDDLKRMEKASERVHDLIAAVRADQSRIEREKMLALANKWDTQEIITDSAEWREAVGECADELRAIASEQSDTNTKEES